MAKAEITITFDPGLHLFVAGPNRVPAAPVETDGTSSLGHVVESLGVPLTEVGALLADGRPVSPGHVAADGEHIEVRKFTTPQRVEGPLRLLLDIHLGTLARRLRLLGIDTAYETPDIGDAALAARSAAEHRVMLSRDRGLLHRRELFAGAYVYSTKPAEQVDEVLARFEPELAPWTRCTACNGELRAVTKEQMGDRLQSGTARTYDTFAECESCGQAYWRGAHSTSLNAIVERATRNR
ncbi:Mut7-C RNAse domain-containing protein [Catenulispora subtropica]|uniref:Mut7-C RNAse domain-containing protein n=1 Tax=Catenulispora subtropica TaxID=450798 RepID=A0ABP5EFJ6_9ACTN